MNPLQGNQPTHHDCRIAVGPHPGQAVQNGYNDGAHMKKDPDLDSLRAREDFQKLLQELEAKPKAADKKA